MITSRDFGTLPDGEKVIAYDFATEDGFRATILSYGATLQSLILPDGIDIILGFDDLEAYLSDHPYFGGIIGRVANRTKGAGFEIGGTRYKISANEGANNLHSGPEGFDRMNWFGEIKGDTLILRHTSLDGHQGFPGELLTELHFKFSDHSLTLDIQAMTSKPCPVNITYHPYFNLANGGATPCIDHELQVLADSVTASDEYGCQTGEMLRTSCRERYNYYEPKPITSYAALDQNFVIPMRNRKAGAMSKMAKLHSRITGHTLIICSTQSCLQAYTGADIPDVMGKSGVRYGATHGVALEPQGFPDAVNIEEFPSNILRPGDVYSHKISYTFQIGEVQA